MQPLNAERSNSTDVGSPKMTEGLGYARRKDGRMKGGPTAAHPYRHPSRYIRRAIMHVCIRISHVHTPFDFSTMTSTSLARARVATLAGQGNASRLWPKGRVSLSSALLSPSAYSCAYHVHVQFARAWVPAFDPYESDDSPSPPLPRPALRTAVSSARPSADRRESSTKHTGEYMGYCSQGHQC